VRIVGHQQCTKRNTIIIEDEYYDRERSSDTTIQCLVAQLGVDFWRGNVYFTTPATIHLFEFKFCILLSTVPIHLVIVNLAKQLRDQLYFYSL